jgi:hypothetical protein
MAFFSKGPAPGLYDRGKRRKQKKGASRPFHFTMGTIARVSDVGEGSRHGDRVLSN